MTGGRRARERPAAGGRTRHAEAGSSASRLRAPGLLLGVGLGGFVDGIVLHQVLQWHHMLSGTGTDRAGLGSHPVDTVAGLEVNTLWDGFFHVATWLFVLAGLLLLDLRGLVLRRRVPDPVLWGWVLAGWGVFNLVEGVLDHHVLGIHHVRDGPHRLWWDLGFLGLGGLLVLAGLVLVRTAGPGGADRDTIPP